MITCFCRGEGYPHEFESDDCECPEDPVEEGADPEPLDYYNREESRYLDRINAADINKHRE